MTRPELQDALQLSSAVHRLLLHALLATEEDDTEDAGRALEMARLQAKKLKEVMG